MLVPGGIIFIREAVQVIIIKHNNLIELQLMCLILLLNTQQDLNKQSLISFQILDKPMIYGISIPQSD